MTKKSKQTLFEVPESWEEHWQGMPEFIQSDKTAYKTVLVHFKNDEDIKKFSKLIQQKMTFATKFIWYPKNENEKLINMRCNDNNES
jgi:hypothetical protein